jgi:hypothetical protein
LSMTGSPVLMVTCAFLEVYDSRSFNLYPTYYLKRNTVDFGASRKIEVRN